MRKVAVLPLLLTSTFASSCAWTPKPIDYDGTKPFAMNMGINEEAKDYLDVGMEASADDILRRVGHGEYVPLLISSGDCSHCYFMQEPFVGALKRYPIDISLIHYSGESSDWSEFRMNVLKLQAKYGESDEGGISGGTPAFYILDDQKAKLVTEINSSAQEGVILNALQKYCPVGQIKMFRDFGSYSSYVSKTPCLSYLHDFSNEGSLSFYEAIIRKQACKKEAEKPIAVIDYLSLSEEDKSLSLASFSLESIKPTLKAGSMTYDASSDEARQIVLDYYR